MVDNGRNDKRQLQQETKQLLAVEHIAETHL